MIKKALSINYSSLEGVYGIQADLKTFLDYHVFGFTVITSDLSSESFHMQADIIKKQFETVFSGGVVQATKIGAIGQPINIKILKEFILTYQLKNIVLDYTQPNFDPSLLANFKKELFPFVDWLILNEAVLDTYFLEAMNLEQALKEISHLGPKNIIIISEETLLFYDGQKNSQQIISKKSNFVELSSTITAHLANGLSQKEIITCFNK